MEFYLVSHPSHPLAQLTQVDDDKQLAQHLQLVIKDTGTLGNSNTGWLKAEQRWTVANFHEAKEILYQGMGFCWMPKLLVEQDLAEARLARIYLLGSQSRKAMMSLVIPNRDRQGPAAKLLEQCILQQHKQE
jgi:DNA-binding transcriptional LysR family regulator